ncbi:MAG: glycosyltransferase family 10 [Deltaproteobacteria bacterium]|nr:glycosyltransferase family 10 [Deltaproteobacteria bacterium]
MMLVRIVKDWDWPDLMRQTPGQKGVWDGIRFTTDPVEACDFLIMLNNRMETDVNVRCPGNHIWAIMQEPYVKGFNDWMIEGHDVFSRVYTHHVPERNAQYIVSQPAIPWHINRNFDELVGCSVPDKTKMLSWIVGHAKDLPGHIKRLAFLKFLQADRSLDIDLFGRAIRYIEDKWEGLAPYRYSLAVENSSSPDYWTEKIGDCFLTWTVPFYYGCTNLEAYFPPDAFIRIDINDPEKTLDVIGRTIREDDWEKRLPALEEARRRILYDYQLFPHIAKMIASEPVADSAKAFQTIPAYRRSIRTSMYRSLYKVKRTFMRLSL